MHTHLFKGRTLWKCLFLSGKPGLSWSVPCCQTIHTDWQPERRETWSASETKQPSRSETWHRDKLVSNYLAHLKHQSVYNVQYNKVTENNHTLSFRDFSFIQVVRGSNSFSKASLFSLALSLSSNCTPSFATFWKRLPSNSGRAWMQYSSTGSVR